MDALPALILDPASAAAAREGAVAFPRGWGELARAWDLDPAAAALLAMWIAVYSAGVARAWRAGGVGRGLRVGEVACFAGGLLALAVAQISPLHPWGNALFSAHMSQHELLMLVAAPLLVQGRPFVALLRALPADVARASSRWTRTTPWRALWGVLVHPLGAWSIHAAALWVWHAPVLFEAARRSELVHAAQHASFLGSALLFWWSALRAGPHATRYGAAVLFLFTTALHSGLLGALLAFSDTAWYPSYRESAEAWGLTALDDQRLGGLIMWIPACALYLGAGVAMCAAWLRESQRSVERWERSLARAAEGGSS
jgi:putative membrane protein